MKVIDQFAIRQLEKRDVEDVIEFINNDFSKRELLFILQRPDTEDGRLPANDLQRYSNYLSHGLSFIAVHQHTQTIAGIAVNITVKADQRTRQDQTYPGVSKCFIPGVKFMEKLEEVYNPFRQLNTDTGMELTFLGVRESHCKQGIARQLAEESIQLARQMGMTFVQSIATNPGTVHLFESLGFETKSEMKLVDFFMDDGLPAFPQAKSTDISRYVVKIL